MREIAVYNPYTNERIGEVAASTKEDVAKAFKKAKECMAPKDVYSRSKMLAEAAKLIKRKRGEFARLITSESGIAIKTALQEVQRSYTMALRCSEEAIRIGGEVVPLDTTANPKKERAIVIREPIGVLSIITPFNHPLNQVIVKLAPAIAAGNRSVIKPSGKVPLTPTMLMGELGELLPKGLANMVFGNPREIGNELITNPAVDMVSFTGSMRVGKQIAKKAGMVKLLLELGDTGPLIVLDDADIHKSAKAAAQGAFGNSGQRCTSVKRVIVADSIANEFSEELVNETLKLKVGDPSNPKTDVGTVINEDSAKSIERTVNLAVRHGASLLCGGKREGAQYWPTVLDHVRPTDKCVTEELFGPVAPIIRVKSAKEALRIANMNPYGLQAGVFTDSLKWAERLIDGLEFGTVVLNEGPGFRSENIPFGGVKGSGIGREGARWSILEMTREKTVVL